MKESNDKLRKIQNDYFRLKQEVIPIAIIVMYLILAVMVSLLLWHIGIPFILLKEMGEFETALKIAIFASINLSLYLLPVLNIIKRKKIKEKYGNCRRKIKIEREKIILNIRKSFTINEIKSYYKESSNSFKNEILDVVIIREINEELGVEKELTIFELLEEIKNNNTVKIKIMND